MSSISAASLEEPAMPMKNPPHVGEVIWHGILEPLGLSVTNAARILGVRRASLSALVGGKAALTAEMALCIHKAFGPDVDHLLRMQVAYIRPPSSVVRPPPPSKGN
jgi:antitoxin HigA-1